MSEKMNRFGAASNERGVNYLLFRTCWSWVFAALKIWLKWPSPKVLPQNARHEQRVRTKSTGFFCFWRFVCGLHLSIG